MGPGTMAVLERHGDRWTAAEQACPLQVWRGAVQEAASNVRSASRESPRRAVPLMGGGLARVCACAREPRCRFRGKPA